MTTRKHTQVSGEHPGDRKQETATLADTKPAKAPTARATAGPENPKDSNSRVTYVPRSDTTSESEAQVLALVYRYILDRYAEKKASGTNDGEGEREREQPEGPYRTPPAGEGAAAVNVQAK
jgi:hypothetical protein